MNFKVGEGLTGRVALASSITLQLDTPLSLYPSASQTSEYKYISDHTHHVTQNHKKVNYSMVVLCDYTQSFKPLDVRLCVVDDCLCAFDVCLSSFHTFGLLSVRG